MTPTEVRQEVGLVQSISGFYSYPLLPLSYSCGQSNQNQINFTCITQHTTQHNTLPQLNDTLCPQTLFEEKVRVASLFEFIPLATSSGNMWLSELEGGCLQ